MECPRQRTGAAAGAALPGLALLATLLAAGCDPDGAEAGLPEFPPEPDAAAFAGLDYPSPDEPFAPGGAPEGPVWLVGIDGATWELMRPLMRDGAMPHLARLVEGGAHGTLLSEEPTISPALWATIATGVPCFAHGVVNFTVKLPGSYGTTSAGPPDRRWPALWELVGAAGGRSAVVSWFGSYPAEAIAGYYVAKGTDPANADPAQVHPESLVELLRGARVEVPDGDLAAIARNEFLRKTLIEDARSLAALRTILRREQPDLVALHLAGVDVVQHVTWRHMDPSSAHFPEDGAPDAALREVIPSYYRWIDRAVGELVELAPSGTTLVLVSDHGAGPVRPAEAFHLQLEVLLEALGLMRADGGGEAFAISEIYRHDKQIWLELEGVEPRGRIPLEQAVERAKALERRLERLRTDDGEPLFASIVNRATGPDWTPGEPALVVRFSSRALLTEEVRDGDRRLDFAPVRLRHRDVSGAHRPEGIIVLHGPGIRPGPLARPANLYQVAPTVLYLLGLPQDRRMLRLAPADGGVLVAAIEEERLARSPVRAIAEYAGTDRSSLLRAPDEAGRPPLDLDPAAADKLERLRSLGYLR